MWSLFSGQKDISLNLGIFFELLWLDLFPAGTFIPPQSVYAVLLTLSISYIFALKNISQLWALIIITNLFSYICVFIESQSRLQDNLSYNKLLKRIKSKDDLKLSSIIRMSIFRSIVYNFIFFYLSLIVIFNFYKTILPFIPEIKFINWNVLWIVAAIGSILSLRIQKSYVLFFLGFTLLGIVYLGAGF
ncbi:MAG: mannose system component [Desulfonauticus sp.]|nr:mannose system component [Desulfonauticus sp.]